MTESGRPRIYQGWPLLANGFRPFFLLGSIYAALAVLVWLPVFYGELTVVSTFAPRDWHVHEMLFGYLPAVITGFLFTAIPNWTGRLPMRGMPLLALVVVWIAGRITVTFSAETGWLAAMLVDASFLTLVAAATAREILAGRNWRNLNVVMLVLLLLAGNLAFHLEAHFHGAAEAGIRIGIAVVVLLISLIGGRIIPSFTRNWLVRENPGRLPVSFGRFDVIVVGISALALVCWIVEPGGSLAGVALALTGLLHLVRLGRWAGDRTARERLLLILHVGYAFVPLGFLLNAASTFGLVPAGAGMHAWMAGAAGIMTLAVMSLRDARAYRPAIDRICHHATNLRRDHCGGPRAYLRCHQPGALRIVASCCRFRLGRGVPWFLNQFRPVTHQPKLTNASRFLTQLVDCRRVEAVFLISLGEGASIVIVVAQGLLLACGADADHVTLQDRLRARQGRFVDVEGFQQSRQLIAGVRSPADNGFKFGRAYAKIPRHACEIAAVHIAEFAYSCRCFNQSPNRLMAFSTIG